MEEQPLRRADDRPHCSAHEKNTTDLAGVKASGHTIKWIVGLGFPAIISAVLWMSASIKSDLQMIKSDVKNITASMAVFQVNDAMSQMDRQQLRRDVDEINKHRRP